MSKSSYASAATMVGKNATPAAGIPPLHPVAEGSEKGANRGEHSIVAEADLQCSFLLSCMITRCPNQRGLKKCITLISFLGDSSSQSGEAIQDGLQNLENATQKVLGDLFSCSPLCNQDWNVRYNQEGAYIQIIYPGSALSGPVSYHLF